MKFDGYEISDTKAIARGAATVPYMMGISIAFCATKNLLPNTVHSTNPATITAEQIRRVWPRLENSPLSNTASPRIGSTIAKSGDVIL